LDRFSGKLFPKSVGWLGEGLFLGKYFVACVDGVCKIKGKRKCDSISETEECTSTVEKLFVGSNVGSVIDPHWFQSGSGYGSIFLYQCASGCGSGFWF
jgi:hypothetical protein